MCVSFHGNGDFQVDWRWGEWHVGTVIGMEKKCVKSDKNTTIPDFVCHKIRDSRFYLFLTNRPIFSTTVWSPG